MKAADVDTVVKTVDKHTLDDNRLDDDITCILENVFTYDMDVINELLDGKWVHSKKVQDALGLSFKECIAKFDFLRKAEWWSVVGKTTEERQKNGQKISTFFRVRTR